MLNVEGADNLTAGGGIKFEIVSDDLTDAKRTTQDYNLSLSVASSCHTRF
jgi:hypothetical protein